MSKPVVDAAYAAELRGWLYNMQETLQKVMDDVNVKLEATKLLETGAHSDSLPVMVQDHDETIPCVLYDGVAPMAPPTEVAISIAEAPQLPGQPEDCPTTKVAFEDPGKVAKKHKEKSQDVCGPGKGQSTSSDAVVERASTRSVEPKQSWLKGCLLKCLCPCRRFKKPVLKKPKKPYVPPKPTDFFTYTKEENDVESIGEKLKGMRKLKAVPIKIWEPRVQIQDAAGKKYSLKALEKAEDGCKNMAFPVEVTWLWLNPNEFEKKNWKGPVWWKKMGLLDNISLRSFSMKVHARMQLIEQEVILLTQGMIKDQEKALASKTSLHAQTDEVEMEMAIDALTDIDDLLTLDFKCGDKFLTIGEVAQAAGVPWEAFLDAYMAGRNSALKCDTNGRRRELILAASKGSDGLEQLYQQLVSKIDANELIIFKVALIVCNGLTCAAQFAWSDFLVPALDPPTTTPLPTWQLQIANLANAAGGG